MLRMYQTLNTFLKGKTHNWLITGVAGFIGSHLLEALLSLDQQVVGLDNFTTGKAHNLDEVKACVLPQQWARFRLLEGDIRQIEECQNACTGIDYVLHYAALGNALLSIKEPLLCNAINIDGSLNMLVASRDMGAKRFIYATSSSTYGDNPVLPQKEEHFGRPLSPYAVTKYVNELYAGMFSREYGFETIGLRYFNIFGTRQDPDGAYAAVIPKWIVSMINEQPVHLYGDGEMTRDFCYVSNAVQACLLSALHPAAEAANQIYNVAMGEKITLNDLYEMLRVSLLPRYPYLKNSKPIYLNFRPGDVMHSQADISKAKHMLGYSPDCTVAEGLRRTIDWYAANV